MQAAARAGVRVFPWVAEFAPDLSAFEDTRPHALSEYEARYGKDYLRGVLGRYWIHLGGRALETFRPLLPTKTLKHVVREAEADCARELTDTSHFHIDLFGNFIPGLCAGLAIACADLDKPLSAEKYPILTVLNEEGIRGFLDFAKREYNFASRQHGYINKCDLCTEIRSFLVQKGYDRSQELAPSRFYA
jgi:hypothetical protein